MSLKFGIYLVEQRIVSPEQFCGLVKIQQEATMSLATIALRKNILTIKQVAKVLDLQEDNPQQSFIQIAIDEDLMDCADADLMLHEQQMSCPSIQRLVVECGLLTQRQSTVLFNHFEKMSAQKSHQSKVETAAREKANGERESKVAEPNEKARPRQPKFIQRPVVVQPYMSKVQK
jgi:hypothetical protein